MRTEVQTVEGHPPSDGRFAIIIAAGVVVILSMVQLYMAIFLIPRFAEIFGDLLGDQPLPAATSTVILCRWLFAGLACLWPLVALLMFLRRAPVRYLLAILIMLLLQVGFTIMALLLPLGIGLGKGR